MASGSSFILVITLYSIELSLSCVSSFRLCDESVSGYLLGCSFGGMIAANGLGPIMWAPLFNFGVMLCFLNKPVLLLVWWEVKLSSSERL